ncbi:MAG: PHP domain-containing protein [Proteocatella sp.]
MFKADSHIHTRNSDGYNTIDEVISMAKNQNLTHIAITDHDTLRGYDEACEKAAKVGIRTIKSIEISAIDKENGKRVHLLGYNIKDDDIIDRLCSGIISQRNYKAEKQIEVLNSKGYKIDYNELYKFAKGYIFKQQMFDMLLRSGQTEAMFPKINETLFKHGGICDIDMEYIDVRKAVKAVKDAGGYAVIAHPCQQNNLYIVDELVKSGLDGLEVNHEANNDEYKIQIIEKAKQHNLILTGGSDYHGLYAKRKAQIGSYLCEESAQIIFQ